MKLKGGLNFDDDDYDPKVNEKTNFEADRNKTNFEKDVDDLLFSGMAPAPRRRRGEQAPPKPEHPKQQTKKPAEKINDKSRESGAGQSTLNIQSKKQIEKSHIPTKPKLNESTDSQKAHRVDPRQPEQKKQPAHQNKVDPKYPQQKPHQQPQKPVQPEKKFNNYVKQPEVKHEEIHEVIEEQPHNPHQREIEEKPVEVDNLLTYNRPAYIRKLKKIAENFNFEQENASQHIAFDIVRPIECQRDFIKKQNSPGFQDDEFPPDSISIGQQHRSELVVFKRGNQIYRNPVFGKYIDPNDIQPGTFSSPQFLSTLSCLAEREENIKRLIESQKINENGFYYVRLNINGVWRYISVDESLPEIDDIPLGARSYNDSQGDLWAALIEKAYAKAYNGYNVFKNTTISREHYLRDLTGVPVRKINVNDHDLGHIINDALERGCPVIAVPNERVIDLGFNSNYSLSVLRSNSKGALELRNSFGTITERSKIPISKQGMFEFSSQYTRDYISYVMIAETNPSLHSSTIQSKHHTSFYSCFSFKLRQANPYGYISISQFDRRLFSSHANYEYSPFRVILEKKNVDGIDGNSVYISGGFSFNSRNLDLAVNLTPGTYYLYCIGQWAQKSYDYDVTIYGNELIEPHKIYYNNFPNIIAECLQEVCLSSGKRSAKGNVDEFILYHEPTNLVLITANSLVDKAYNFTLNLNQVKFETLSLLNAVHPGDIFSKKSREELEEYKSTCFSTRTWDANLLPHEKYTWVFSTCLDYNPANFKMWAFRN